MKCVRQSSGEPQVVDLNYPRFAAEGTKANVQFQIRGLDWGQPVSK